MIKRLLILLLLCAPASLATTRYVAQTAGTFSGGTACNTQTAITPATFNGLTLSAGDITYLCGTITGSAGVSGLIAIAQSGSSGNVISLIFDTGASLQAPYFAIAINLGSSAFILVNGGTNGFIENTLNGTTGGSCPGGPCSQEQSTKGIATTGGNVEIKNLTIGPLYTRVSGDPLPSPGDYTLMQCINFAGSNVLIHDNILHDAGWCLNQNYGNDDNVQIYNNNIYGHDHGYAAAGANFTMQNIYFHDNHLHDFNNWDGSGGHHDGVHGFNGSGGRIVNFYSYNNLFNGNQGTTMTAWIFMEGNGGGTPWNGNNSTSAFYSWNDVVIGTEADTNGEMAVFGGQVHYYNDTIFGGATGSGSVCVGNFQSTGGSVVTMQNTILQRCNQLMDFDSGVSAVTFTNNVYGDASGGSEIFHWAGKTSGSTNTLAAWQTACTCDTSTQASLGGLLANLSSTTGIPSSGFIGILAGTNLTSTATGNLATLASTTSAGNSATPSARPSVAAWDVGAFAFSTPTASTPTFSPVAGSYSSTQSVTITASTGGVICYNTTGSPQTNGTTGCTAGTLYTTPVSVAASETLFAVAGGTGFVDSAVGSAAYTITTGAANAKIGGGAILGGGTKIQ